MHHFQKATPTESHLTETNSVEGFISGGNVVSESRDDEGEEDMSFDTEEIRHLKFDFKGTDPVEDSTDETSDLMQMTTCFGGFIDQTQENLETKGQKYQLIEPCLEDMFELDNFLKKDEGNVMQMPFDIRGSMNQLKSTKENPEESPRRRPSFEDDDMKETLAFNSLIVTMQEGVCINPSQFESITPNLERKEDPDQVSLKADQGADESSPILSSSAINDIKQSQESTENVEPIHGLSNTPDPKSPIIIESDSKLAKVVHEALLDQANDVVEIEGEDMEIISDPDLNYDRERFEQTKGPEFQIFNDTNKLSPTKRPLERPQTTEFTLSQSLEPQFAEMVPKASPLNIYEGEDDSSISVMQLTQRFPINEDSSSLSSLKLPSIGRPEPQSTVLRPTETQFSGELTGKMSLDQIDQSGPDIGMTLKEFLRFVNVRFLDTLTATSRRETLGHLRNAGRYEHEFPSAF